MDNRDYEFMSTMENIEDEHTSSFSQKTTQANIPEIVLSALDTNIAFKTAELNVIRNRSHMQVSRKDSREFNGIVKNFSQDDYVMLNAFLRSVLNADGKSIIQDGMDYNQCVYMILNEICVMLRSDTSEADRMQNVEIPVEILQAFSTCYDGYMQSHPNKDDDPDTIRVKQANMREQITNMNLIIQQVPFLARLNTNMRAIFPKVQDFKKLLIKSNDLMDRTARETEDKINELGRQLNLLNSVKELQTKGEHIDGVPCEATIFSSVSFPSFKGEKRGFTYVCGHCGKEHFLEEPPFLIHHIPNYTTYDLSKVKDTPDKISAQALTFDPVVCPDCNTVNLFTSAVITQLKILVLHDMNQGRYKMVGKNATTQLNLDHSAIHPVFADSPIEIVTSEPVKIVKSMNPLNDQDQFDDALASFIQFVKDNQTTTRMVSSTDLRNISWLRSLYKISQDADVGTDEFSFVMSYCEAAGFDRSKIVEIGTKIQLLRSYAKTNQALINIHKCIQDTVYKDIRVSADIEEHVGDVLTQIEHDLGMSAEEIEFNESNLIQSLVNDVLSKKESVDFDKLRIRYFNQNEYKDILASGLIQDLWVGLSDKFIQVLAQTVTSVVMQNPSSKLFLHGTLKEKADDQMKQLNNIRANAGLSRYDVVIPDMYDRVYAIIQSAMSISDYSVFVDKTGANAKFMALCNVPSNIPYGASFVDPNGGDDKVDDNTVKKCSDIFGLDYGYEELLTGRNIDDVVDTLAAGNDYDQCMISIYLVGYLFAHCVPVTNKGYLAIQEEIKSTLTKKAEDDRKYLERLGVEYI